MIMKDEKQNQKADCTVEYETFIQMTHNGHKLYWQLAHMSCGMSQQ